MIDFYYSPGSCSLAVHIALQEAGLPHRRQRIEIAQGQQLTDAYRAVHPLARVPALRTDAGHVLTEVPALLEYVANCRPETELLPADLISLSIAREWMSFFASAVHPAFLCLFRPDRFSSDEQAQRALRSDGRLKFWELLRYTEDRLPGNGAVLATGPSLVDAYAFVMYLWGLRVDLEVAALERYTALVARVIKREATHRAMRAEGLDSVLATLASSSGQLVTHSQTHTHR